MATTKTQSELSQFEAAARSVQDLLESDIPDFIADAITRAVTEAANRTGAPEPEQDENPAMS